MNEVTEIIIDNYDLISKTLRVAAITISLGVGLYTLNRVKCNFGGYQTASRGVYATEDSRHELQEFSVDKVLEASDIPRLAKQMAARARLELHLVARDEAELIQLREWTLRTMTSMDVRKVDQLEVLPYVLKLAYLETRAERRAREMTLSPEYQSRLDRTNTRIWLYEPPTWDHWLGRIVSEPTTGQH